MLCFVCARRTVSTSASSASCEDGRVFLTPEGMFVSSYILSDLLDFDGDIAEGEASGKRA